MVLKEKGVIFAIDMEYMDNKIGRTFSIVSEEISSKYLERNVKVDFYVPDGYEISEEYSLLLINDGQDLFTMDFKSILEKYYSGGNKSLVIFVGIHCGADRKNEYGTAGESDYKGRGNKAGLYTDMIFEELLPFVRKHSGIESFKDKSYCGFSLGGLSALDIVWNYSGEFLNVGVFSGSLWWRNLSQEDPTFDEAEHRIMHTHIKRGSYHPWLRFFFESGTLDEVADRNGNGIIDAIDDTTSLIEELVAIGYDRDNIKYLEIENGGHNVETWGKAFPDFLKWCWG